MSVKINVYNQKAENVGTLDLSDKIFKVALNNDLLHQAVIAQMANERQVLAHTKTRAEVSGGGKKPWKQKGTGRARVGSSRSPIWRGGGVIFGPRNERNFKKQINQKMKQKALLMALSDKVNNNTLVILEKLDMPEFKTKTFNAMLTSLEKKVLNNTRRNVLIINDQKDEKVKYSGRNLPGVEIINLENLNIVDVLKYKNLVLTSEAIKKLEERYK
ncbi:50S ribosomal protein L4 [Candidatus Falkowbacteria bacterium CG_4_10_14_0_8_um_filter_41_36]|uniref:Large ribosomal subunit protein uL4 n=3 Tax=Candidatus Falkowiibacteriota TaxID=1752728 RepID=A0A2G9ZM96_9BACT|nr:MAG: 50S ribosomal protein L4 [Candidatus Falkowbacteria bacterium CG1_02_41_21]PIP34287.1 MAG: 50S ribosomal protein L4 [Candidatus Falkowbacteria bacterium CG23_combo_of_CG06-09_8_20_14_all_41_10]PIZ10536.1 MAG: 50S ribosomal protein L4 [Candidatus Falkowbacteria bacterium CG_4_10_14_0_8_um_filter_41_36]